MYYVFKRNDGYVSAMNLSQWNNFGKDDCEILLETTEWDEAHDLIVRERAKPGYPSFEWDNTREYVKWAVSQFGKER